MRFLEGFLKLHPGEFKKVKYLLIFFFSTGFYGTIIDSISVAVFDIRFGAKYLPYLYILFPFINALFLFVYIKKIPALDKRTLFRYFMVTLLLLHILGFFIIAGAFREKFFYAILLVVSLLFVENFILFAMLLLQEVTDIESIKRLLPVTSGTSTIGSVAAALIVNNFAGIIKPEVIFLASAVFIIFIAISADILLKRFRVTSGRLNGIRNAGLRETLVYMKENSFYLLLILLAAVICISFNINDYLYNVTASRILAEESKMMKFIGATTAFQYILSLSIDLFLFVRIVMKLGSLNSVKFVLFNAAAGTALMFLGESQISLVLVSKVVFSVLVIQMNLSLEQILFNPVSRRYKDSVMIITTVFVSFAGYMLGGAVSLLHSRGITGSGTMSALSIMLIALMFVLWQVKQTGFVSVIKRTMNSQEDLNVEKLFGSTGTINFIPYAARRSRHRAAEERVIAHDFLKHLDFSGKTDLIKQAFMCCNVESRLKLVDMVFDKSMPCSFLGEEIGYMDRDTINYLLMKVFLNYKNAKNNGIVDTISRNKNSFRKDLMDEIHRLVFEYLFEGNEHSYEVILRKLNTSNRNDEYILMLKVMKSFAGIEDDINRRILKDLVIEAGGCREVLENAVELCALYDIDINGGLKYLTGLFPESCSYAMMENVCNHYGAHTVLKTFSESDGLIQKTYLLYSLRKLEGSDIKAYYGIYEDVLKRLNSIAVEELKIIKCGHPAQNLLIDEIEKLMYSISAVLVDYMFLYHGLPLVENLESHLASESKRGMVYEIVKNSLPINTADDIVRLLNREYEIADEGFCYGVLDIGGNFSALMHVYMYIGGEYLDEELSISIARVIVLKSAPIFRELDMNMLNQVLRIARYKKVDKGEVVVRKGEEGDTFYVILDGEAGVYLNEDAEAIAQIGSGDIFGELAVIDKDVRTATVKALRSTILLEFCGEDFVALLMKNGAMAYSVIRTLSRRLRDMLQAKV